MMRASLSKVDLSVKCSFAKLILANGYTRFFFENVADHLDLIEAYTSLRGNDFEFGSGYQHIRLFQKEKEEGIATIENDGLSYRSFIYFEDGTSKVFRSVYISPSKNKNECYISSRFFCEDQSLIEITGIIKGKNNEIKEVCANIYDPETIGKYMETHPHFNPAEIGEDIKSYMSPSRTLILLPSDVTKNIDVLQRHLDCFSKTSEILTLSKSDKTGGKIPYEVFIDSNLLKDIFNKTILGGNMEAKDKGTDLCEELRILEEIVPEAERNITIDSLINKFSNKHQIIGILMSFMGDLDLQPDLSDYGYKNYSVPVKLYLPEDAIIAEKLRLLRRTAAIIRLKDAMENHKAGMPLRSECGKNYGLIRNNETGEVVLDIFDKDHVQQGSIIIYKKMLLIGDSYETQLVVIRYSGNLAGEPGMFYEVVEDLANRGQIASLLIQAYDETTVLSPDMYDFSYMLPGKPIDENLIHICNIPHDKMDLVRGLSLGLHPERIAEICKEENPIGSARRKKGTLQA